MLSATQPDEPAFNNRSRTAQQHSSNDSTPHTDAIAPVVPETGTATLKSLSADRLNALLQMQKTDPFCKCISKCLSNGKVPKNEADIFYTCKRTALQTCHTLTPKILSSHDPKGMEIHGIDRSA